MEDINTRGSATVIIERKLLQPRLIIQALAFTGILYFTVGQTPRHTTGLLYESVSSNATLSASVSKSVLQYASRQSGLPTSTLQIVHAHPQTWSDNCLELHDAAAVCTQIPVPGWHVAVASGKQSWSYRTDASGSLIKMEQGTSSPRKQSKEIVKRDRNISMNLS
ncbi:MAG TPA: hypothetical protein V6D14_15850 [Coleofasciculaceae cyanobacterium]